VLVSWTDPSALWLLAVLPLLWLALSIGRTTFNRRQHMLQAAVRSLLLAAIACALARPVIATTSSRQSIVYIVDVSYSVASRAIQEAADRIDQLNRDAAPAHFRIVAFGATATVLENSNALRQLAAQEPGAKAGSTISVDRAGSDLEAAIDVARAELAPGYIPRLILFSDGQTTAGDATAAAARLAADRIPLSVEPLAVRSIGDSWVEEIDLPEKISAGEMFAATVHVGTQRDVPATIEVAVDGKTQATQKAVLTRGSTAIPVNAVVPTVGAHVLKASVHATGDPLDVNDALEQGVWAGPRAKVLYIEGTSTSAHYLSTALKDAGFDVSVQAADTLPDSVAGLDAWDAVILSDVARTAISEPAMAALSEWVEKRGGGLLVAGGESVFGEGGYRETPIERVLPVTFERRDEPQVALIIVLDRSWSMSGTAMDLCKSAAQAAVDVMTDEQFVGVLTFNDQFDWDVTLRNVGKNRDYIKQKIAAIEAAGHTLIYPAVEQAYLALRTAKARAKHVILLSDGRSYPDDYEGLVKKMVAANMTVSSVAVGPAADDELLGNIAKWGKGRAYVVQNPKDVPQIFVKEAKNAMTPGFDEKGITPIVKNPAFLTGVDLEHIPALKGRTVTVIKDSALQVITSDDDDPLLAFWPVGLGRAAVFASDVKDRWAANWITWPGYEPFFASIVRAIQRQRPPSITLDLDPGPVHGHTRAVSIAVEARDENGGYRNLLRPVAQVRVGAGSTASLPLRQVAPGRYESSVIADASQALNVSIASQEGLVSRVIVPDAAAEYRFRPADEPLLRSLALATGGAWKPTVQTLANSSGDRRTERRPLWPGLIVAGLVLWLLDILLRRVRVFEPTVSAS
jgi:uncharacterized membrane protein